MVALGVAVFERREDVRLACDRLSVDELQLEQVGRDYVGFGNNSVDIDLDQALGYILDGH